MAMVYRFDDFTLDADAFELRRAGVIVPIEPLVFDLINVLVDQPGVVLSRDFLIETVWKGRSVAESAVSTAIKLARRALGDTGVAQKYIRTIRGRGIQFSVPVVRDETRPDEAAPATHCVETQPELYIHPFETMGDPSLDHLASAMRVRTGSILARIPLLRIASSFSEADRSIDPRELRARFDISLVLDVRLQRVAKILKADTSLTETRTGVQIWAQQFETATGAGDQEILLHKMIRFVEPRLMQAMVTEMQAAGTGSGSRTNLLKAIAMLALKGWHQTTFVEATKMIEQAIEQEPGLALSHAYLALLKALGHRVGLLRDDDSVVPAAIAAAERALELENQDSTILGLVGCAFADVGQVDRAIPILRKAIERDPQNGHAKTALGSAFMMKHDYKTAVMYLTEGLECSPADSRRSVWGAVLAMGLLAQGELDKALEAAESACAENDRTYLPRLALAAVHLARRDQDKAVSAVRESLRTKPDLSPDEIRSFVGDKPAEKIWALARSLNDGAIAKPK